MLTVADVDLLQLLMVQFVDAPVNAGYALQAVIVENHQLTAFAPLHIELNPVDVHIQAGFEARKGVLRMIERGTAMAEEDRFVKDLLH
jgi:hypothetical protein